MEAPLTSTPTPYFLCSAQSYGRYSLGRAFLQAAFSGANWNANNNAAVRWLAQATGPNIASQNVKSIQPSDISIEASANNWTDSWKGHWLPIQDSASSTVSSTGSPTTGTVTASTSKFSSSSNGLSMGAEARIGIGVTFGIIAMLIISFLFWRRQHAPLTKKSESSTDQLFMSHSQAFDGPAETSKYPYGRYGPAEMDAGKNVYELSAS